MGVGVEYQGSEFRVCNSMLVFRVRGLGLRVQGSEFGDWGSRFWVHCSGFRVEILGLKI